jgi:hypothetical protein
MSAAQHRSGHGVRDRLRRRRRPAIAELEGPPERTRAGVILTLSHDSDAAQSAAVLAIRHLRPSYLGFLGTPQTDERRVATTSSRRAARSSASRWSRRT